jgi:hypothetical protein
MKSERKEKERKIPESSHLSGCLDLEINQRISASEKHPLETEIAGADLDG